MCRFLRNFWRERRAAAGAEFALLSIMFAGILLGIIDFNMILWEHNKAEKACQVGARYAIMNDMVATDLSNWSCETAGVAARAGDPIPLSALTPNPVVCDGTSCSAFGYESDAYNAIVAEMGTVWSRVLNDPNVDIEISYEHVGHGFCGVPNGPDIWPLTTVSVSGPTHNFITPLVGALTTIEFDCEATLVGEDFNTCENGTGAPWC